jgi:hypothetical protein
MVNFPKPPLVRHITTSKCILEEDFSFTVKVKDKYYHIEIKQGFIFDGASIPRIAWRVMEHPFQMPLLVCALPHDILYASELFTQSECDWIFLELMQMSKIGWIKRNLVYTAVRAGGWCVWMKHTKYSINKAKSYMTVTILDK